MLRVDRCLLWFARLKENNINKELRTWHTDASEGPWIVETGSVVLARVRLALVDVGLAPRSGESLGAVAGERARRVHAHSVVLARRTCRSNNQN